MFSRRPPGSLQDAGSCAEQIALWRFIDDITFEPKPGDLGMILSLFGIDPDCRTDATLRAFSRLDESISIRVPSDLCRSAADLHQFEVLDALEVCAVAREQRQTMGQSNTGDQTVSHSDCLASPCKLAANICRMPCGGPVKRQHTACRQGGS